MSTQTVPMDDKELLSAAISDEPVAETPQETPVEIAPETTEQLRDASGRFAKADEPQAVVETPSAPQSIEAQVPSWRLREERERAEAAENRSRDFESRYSNLERQLAELQRQNQPKPEPVDFYQNPDGAMDQRFAPFENRLQEISQSQTLESSELRALIYHGKDAVEEARKAVQEGLRSRDPDVLALDTLASRSRDPWSVVIKWHQQSKLQKEIGGDLNGYNERYREQLLNDPKFLATAMEKARAHATGNPGTKPLVQLPPSINRTPAAASSHGERGDMSDQSLYANSIR